MAGPRTFVAYAVPILLSLCADAFYLPGAAPHNYRQGEKVDLFVNALTPMLAGTDDAKLKSLINYDYYNPKFHFCEPEGGPKKQPESLGSILFGDRIFNSPYDIRMLENNGTCQTLCTVRDVPGEDAKFINDRIREDYALNWLIDGLPAAEMKVDLRTGDVFYDMGFNLGNDDEPYHETPALNNHYDIYIRYHSPSPDNYRVVGVLVWPSSHGGPQDGPVNCEEEAPPLILSETAPNMIRYTYRVTWNESDTPWATRWDNYLHIFDPRIHWFSLINSLVIVVFLCIMVSMILLRSVSRDISRYNAIDLSEDVQEDWGWKLVHGEVFRTPRYPMALSVLVGNGAQLCAMVAVTLVFALLGFLSPSNRGSLATVMMVCWTFFGGIGGYISSRVYASMGGTDKRKNSFITATILPTTIFAIIFLLNLFLLAAGSSGAVPFGTMLFIVILWFGISAPLSAIGSYFGSKHGAIQHPVRVNPIPRQIPPTPKYLRPWAATLLSGILPFGAAFVELYFVLSSLFASRAYYAFGFLALTAFVVALTTATVTILFTYFILCAEEYRWHWRAFLTGGGSAFWLLAYGFFYWLSRLSLDSFSSTVLYFGYLFLLCLFDFLITGTIGFLATYWAVRRLYSSIRID
ncbi:Nonaspanin [Gloeophyllum trabeum ATCC 11539]|uniref:Transmembrane 9 superfamily member n=1 Tax=Gloeophyllum trabeum (strain ATCC 11539 / FP-39264 / Madison 617) TaxID=670483 RepID=S7QCY7_GLOTA|nr:Nonaspanin [Gloeophyllum trabeum ATCC 11539]EPQ57217.1 Nonaspanin [Gloeophyllum trabeum ATCC 11539]